MTQLAGFNFSLLIAEDDNALPAFLMATGFGLDPLEFTAVEGPETDGLVGVWGG